MSKIEEALRRARSEREEQVAVGDAAPAAGPKLQRARRMPRAKDLVGLSAAEEIAHMREPFTRSSAELAARRIIDKNGPDTRTADAFRQLRTAILQRAGQSNFVLMVSSVSEHGGASFVATNLAASIAFDEGRTALVVDCNLHNSSHDQLIESPAEAKGLTDYLSGREGEVEKIIHPVGIPRLRLLPAGSHSRSAMEYFTAPRLSHLMRELKQRYRERCIIVDAPSISDGADARILAEICDYSLLTVPYGRVSTSQVATAAAAIGEDKLIGCVLNDEVRMPLMGRHRGKRAG